MTTTGKVGFVSWLFKRVKREKETSVGWISLCAKVPLPKTTGKQFCPKYGTESLEKLEVKF